MPQARRYRPGQYPGQGNENQAVFGSLPRQEDGDAQVILAGSLRIFVDEETDPVTQLAVQPSTSYGGAKDPETASMAAPLCLTTHGIEPGQCGPNSSGCFESIEDRCSRRDARLREERDFSRNPFI